MARGFTKWTENLIARLIKEGRGVGEGVHYKPWICIGDFPSAGRTHDPLGLKTGRPHQLLSDNEMNCFLFLEWAMDIVDIREQFPLDRTLTQEVAMQIKAPHQYYPGTQVPFVMTADFMVTRVRDGKKFQEAFNVKSAQDCENSDTLSHLEIQRESLHRMGIEHHLVLDKLIPADVASRLEWIRGGQRRPNEQEPYPGFFDEQLTAMTEDMRNRVFPGSLAEYCSLWDSQRGIARGTSLRLARMLMSQRVLQADLTFTDLARAPFSSFAVSAQAGSPVQVYQAT